MASNGKEIELIALPDVPLIRPGDDLWGILAGSLEGAGIMPQNNDVLVVAQKIVSKAEGRYVCLDGIEPSRRARELAEATDKDPRLVEVILGESEEVLRYRPGLLIVVHKLGLVMANAGVDQSNLEAHEAHERVLLLPTDPDRSSAQLKDALDRYFRTRIGVVISDSVGRPWRAGTVGVALGAAGFPALEDLRGQPDLYGRPLQVSQAGLADMIASSAALLMGEGAEGSPAVLVRGVAWSGPAAPGSALIRPREADLFR